jgi:uncharacterized protein
MNDNRMPEALILGLFICLGLLGMGYLVAESALKIKEMDRFVTVKGLAERDVEADVAIWPIAFNEADNDLNRLYSTIGRNSAKVVDFLKAQGFDAAEITVAPPSIVDRQAQSYGDTANIPFRFTASATVTVYTKRVNQVREAMTRLLDLGQEGIAITRQEYENKTEFLFTDLNRIKPAMIEEATLNAREVASTFAKDSSSRLGKIRTASQGQFSISDRDSSTPHIKQVRVVSTVEYYLAD